VRTLDDDDDDDDTGRENAGAGAAGPSLGDGTAEAATDAAREGALQPRDEAGCADAATGTGGGRVDPARDTDEAALREDEDVEVEEEATEAGAGGAAAPFLCEDRDAPDATDATERARLDRGSSRNSCSSPCSSSPSSSCGPTSATGGEAPGRDWYFASENGRDASCGDECSSSESEKADSSECRCRCGGACADAEAFGRRVGLEDDSECAAESGLVLNERTASLPPLPRDLDEEEEEAGATVAVAVPPWMCTFTPPYGCCCCTCCCACGSGIVPYNSPLRAICMSRAEAA